MKNFYFLLFTIFTFNLTNSQVTELYISQYGEGSSNNKFYEIYNGTDQTVDLSNYAFAQVTNAPTDSGVHEYWNDFPEGAVIAAGDVFVIAHPLADDTILAVADYTYNYLSNGNDGFALASGTDDNPTYIDWLGDFNGDPGSGWSVAGVSNATKDHTLTRKSTVCGPNNNWTASAGTNAEDSEWIVTGQNSGWNALGAYTGCVSNPDPTLNITAPGNGSEFASGTTSVSMSLSVLDFTVGTTDSDADGHIHWSINGEDQPMKYDLEDEEISVTDGETYTLYVELVDGNHQPIDPATNQTVIFSVAIPDPTLPIYEAFDYTTGIFSSSIWDFSGDDILVNQGNLSYSGLDSPTGNHVTFDGSGSDPILNFTAVTSGTVYASFLFQVTDQSSMTDVSDGGYFAILGNYDSRLWVRPNPDAASNTFDIGFGFETSNPQTTSETFEVGQTIFVVMVYDLDSGTTSLWVNPTADELEANSPPTTTTISAVDTATISNISKFYIRQDSPGETPSILMDELRIGETWSDVTPTTLSNADFISDSFKLYPNPSNSGFVNITSTAMGAIQYNVFDMLGKQVVIDTTVVNGRLNVSDLNAGIYIVKLTQNNSTITKKLIIQ